jgi:DNA-binding response OmpR family regulator
MGFEMIKKLRKISNMTILCITQNGDILSNIKELGAKNLKESQSFEVELLEDKVDLVIIDFAIKSVREILDQIRLAKPLLPKVVIMENLEEKSIATCVNAGVYSIVKAPIEFDQLKASVIMAINQSKRVDKICLDQDIYFDAYRERFYDKFGEITFTKFEFQLLKLLLDNYDKVVSYDDIKNHVWKDKKMSVFTMRNVVNKIRNKTYYNIIKNISSAGYQIDKPR